MIEFLIVWLVLGLIGYVIFKVNVYKYAGEVAFGWDDLWMIPAAMCVGLAFLVSTLHEFAYFKQPWFVIKKKEK